MISRQFHFKALGITGLLGQPLSVRHGHHLLGQIRHPNAAFTNRSMSECLRRNLPCEALDIFKKQVQLGFVDNVDKVTVALALKACCGHVKPGCQIHGLAVSWGFVSYITVSNSLMNMYCKSGEFERASRIFENLSDPDIVSWNTVLSGFQKSQDALGFALRMNLNGVVFDPVTYTTLLAFCSDDEDFQFGWQLHCLAIKFGFYYEVFVANAFISMHSRCGRLEDARRVFDEMPIRDLVSWNAMLSGYTQEGDHGLEVILAFTEMMREGMRLDHVSFTSALSACGQERTLELGRQIHGLIIKTGYVKHVSVCNVLISMYSKCEIIEDAKLVFQMTSERNVISWTTMISLNEEDAVSLFNEMRLNDIYPNDVTFVGLIHAISIRKLVEEGSMIHGFCIKAGFLSEANISNSLVTMYAKFETMEDSLKVFEELNYREIISWNALISGYAQNGMPQEALRKFFSAITESKPNQYTFGSVFSAIGAAEDISLKHGQRCHCYLIKLGLDTDPIVAGTLLDMYAKRGSIWESQKVFSETPQKTQVSWTAIISAYSRHGDYESVLKLFKEMEREGVKPDSITFLSVLTACSRKGMVDMGRQLFDSMVKEYEIERSQEHYSCMVDMLGRAGRLEEAEDLVDQIQGQPGLSVLQSLLGACRIHGNVEMGERIANALMERDSMESGSYMLLSNLYAEKGQWEKVAKIRKGMRERGMKKEVGFSWVDTNGVGDSLYLHKFSSGDKSHPQSEEIYRIAECIGLELKFLREQASGRQGELLQENLAEDRCVTALQS